MRMEVMTMSARIVLAVVLVFSVAGCGSKTECDPSSGGIEEVCGSNVGACRAGWRYCQEDGSWSACLGAVEPAEEDCDGKDNDCDGQTDEVERPCQNACGVAGTERCTAGGWLCDVLDPLEAC